MQKASKLIEQLNANKYLEILSDIYVDKNILVYQKERYIKAIETYISLYGDHDIEIYSAPGRSEIGGNHTDHQHGIVLAAAINLDIIIIASKTEDNIIRITSDNITIDPIDVTDLEFKESEKETSTCLVKGVAFKLNEHGYQAGGFNAYMTSDVLHGSGLSSSAAFETAVGTIISGLFHDMKIDPVLIAQVGQFAENVYFGKPSGLMDQMASSVGSLVKIDFNDTQNPIIHKLSTDFSQFGHSLCIIDTKGSHADLTDEYAAIPIEMKKVANFFGKDVLREVDVDTFYKNIPSLRKEVGDRGVLRAIHFFRENERAALEADALEKGDFETFKNLITESGNSSFNFLQNVYTNKDVANQSVSIALAVSETLLQGGKGVCRVHGGGFAGTIQAFVKDDEVKGFQSEIEKVFGENSCHVLKIRKYGGIKVI